MVQLDLWYNVISIVMHRILVFFLLIIMPSVLQAEQTNLVSAMQKTYLACVDIDDKLSELKKMAGINTAIGAVGTGLGVGAFAVGIAKTNVDAEAEEIEVRIEALREIAAQGSRQGPKSKLEIEKSWFSDSDEDFLNEITFLYDSDAGLSQDEERLQELVQKSKNLGNWRTGLSAGVAATSVAGAVVSGVSHKKIGIEESVAECNEAVRQLSAMIVQARLNGEDVAEAETIVSACSGFDTVDVSKIAKMSNGTMASSIVGATTGVTGTVLSAVANSENVRADNTEQGKQKEKNLNTASNVLTAGESVANVVSTVFSAVQIAELKKMVAVSEVCTGVLK